MKIFTGIMAAYFLVIAAANVYFAYLIQSGMAVAQMFGTIVLGLEKPLVWILNKIPHLYIGNMHALADITMRSSLILMSGSFLLLIACILWIRVED